MYIKTLKLENFQSFELGEFELSPNLNVLIGISNVGKTAVARALQLVLFNVWDKSWVRNETKFCRVTLRTDTGIEVIREKGEKVNKYILRLPNEIEQVYESFGINVPEDIQQALKIHEVQVDSAATLNLNVSGQLDSLFLLSETGSYRAKVLGKLSGATFLDYAIRSLNLDKRQITAEKNTKSLESIELLEQIDKLKRIEEFSDPIQEIEQKLTSLSSKEDRLQQIQGLFERVKAWKQALSRETKIEGLVGQSQGLIIDKLEDQVNKLKVLKTLLVKTTNWKLSFEKQDKLKESLAQVNIGSIPSLEERTKRIRVLKELCNKYHTNSLNIANQMDKVQDIEVKHQDVLQEYNRILKDAGSCPICGVSTVTI